MEMHFSVGGWAVSSDVDRIAPAIPGRREGLQSDAGFSHVVLNGTNKLLCLQT